MKWKQRNKNNILQTTVDLQLTLWSTKPGIKNLFFLSPGPWNVKEMAEEQLQTITKHFQWSCEMPWIQSIPSEARIALLWSSAPPLAKSIFCPSLAGFPHQTLRRLCLLTPWNKEPLSLFLLELPLLALPSFCLPECISYDSSSLSTSQLQTLAAGETQSTLHTQEEIFLSSCPTRVS